MLIQEVVWFYNPAYVGKVAVAIIFTKRLVREYIPTGVCPWVFMLSAVRVPELEHVLFIAQFDQTDNTILSLFIE